MASCEDAARRGDLQRLRELRATGATWDCKTMCAAAVSGHMDCLKYVHENGCPWDEWTCAYTGHLDCLKYTHENGCPWGWRTCAYTAERGDLDCLKYAHENGCPWNSEIPAYAAASGHLNCLEYLHERGCPLDASCSHDAAYFGHLDCLAYALERGCPSSNHMQLDSCTRKFLERRRRSALLVSRACRAWLARRRADVALVLAGRWGGGLLPADPSCRAAQLDAT